MGLGAGKGYFLLGLEPTEVQRRWTPLGYSFSYKKGI